jgi:bifunctional UDP-N-acetylglucosamine pyrophosphorylase/glucosamine-1-phosphate N-acetyltransferase
MPTSDIKQALIGRGVTIRCPESVDIQDDIIAERIAPGVLIHSGCRLSGARTSIGPDSVIGAEAPVTLQNSQLGKSVHLKGGFFSGATLLDDATFGSGAHVRPGTLLEEHASCAHSVGLKQTLLMPFVTLGSLINFCDCLMAGGTSASNHSEVGSSYIHFNFTAHQDKATPSLVGDVPAGVMLNQPPIFLGGQGGLVGPTRITYGTVVAAGVICRRDVLSPGKLVFGQTGGRLKEANYDFTSFGEIDRIIQNNFLYIGNLQALQAWYRDVRPLLTDDDTYAQACLEGARQQLQSIITERVKRLTQLADKVAKSLGADTSTTENGPAINQRRFLSIWPDMIEPLSTPAETGHDSTPDRALLLQSISESDTDNYITTIQALPPEAIAAGERWLQSIVTSISSRWGDIKNG